MPRNGKLQTSVIWQQQLPSRQADGQACRIFIIHKRQQGVSSHMHTDMTGSVGWQGKSADITAYRHADLHSKASRPLFQKEGYTVKMSDSQQSKDINGRYADHATESQNADI